MRREYPIDDEYFEWLCDIVCGNRFAKEVSYRSLLACLHGIDFIYTIPKDGNRAEDGTDLRYRFAHDDADRYLRGPCSVLEMLVALSIRCEETIMDDPSKGDRTGQWFWVMITNLGLGSMTDDRYDDRVVYTNVDRFMHRSYDPDGTGGLFKIRNCEYDLRDVELWYQLCWYLDSIT